MLQGRDNRIKAYAGAYADDRVRPDEHSPFSSLGFSSAGSLTMSGPRSG
jgi:hypothetical protein